MKEFIRNTPTEKMILALLKQKPHQKFKVNYWNIAQKIEKSTSNVSLSLRKLKEMGLIQRSHQGAWHIVPEKEPLIEKILLNPFPVLTLEVENDEKPNRTDSAHAAVRGDVAEALAKEAVDPQAD